ncbi:MAG TPA: PilZ domain-containing protein [Acidimicrobiia bacterium]|nr:PilZ domain-containing protein [Acidimicrobiia bacterium]
MKRPAMGEWAEPAATDPEPDAEADRRSAVRVSALLELEVRAREGTAGTRSWRQHPEGGRVLTTTTEDLSTGGLSFHAPRAVAPGSRIEMLLETDNRDLHLTGVVAHSRANGTGASVGVRFDRPHRSVVGHLERVIASYRRRLVPHVSIGFRARCRVGTAVVYGATSDCSPGGLGLTLDEAVRVGAPIDCALFFGEEKITLTGRVVSCRAAMAGRYWSVGVQLDEQTPVIAQRWRAVLDERRTSI